jgi:hypothetical protein
MQVSFKLDILPDSHINNSGFCSLNLGIHPIQ